jgi:hypothetical protein
MPFPAATGAGDAARIAHDTDNKALNAERGRSFIEAPLRLTFA